MNPVVHCCNLDRFFKVTKDSEIFGVLAVDQPLLFMMNEGCTKLSIKLSDNR